MEIFLNIIPQHFICTEIRRIIKHIQRFGAALKNICNIKNCYCYHDYCEFTAIMSPQKTNQPIQYLSEKARKVWHDQNDEKWLTKLTKFIKINNHKLKKHTKPIQTPKTEPSAKSVNNQGPFIVFEKRSVLDV